MNTPKRARGRPRSAFSESGGATLQSLDRALGLLATVARFGHATLTDLALAQGLPAATAHRILTTLQKHGFVDFDRHSQEWMIGIEAYRTGSAYLRRAGLTEIGQPILRALMEKTGETANLAVPDGTEVVFIAQVETAHPIRAFFPAGTRSPMHASGTGKAILAMMPPERARTLLQKAGLPVFTSKTLSTPNALFQDLDRTRTRGWSYEADERHDGMSCIGAAIFDENGLPCAGISISGPSGRFKPDSLDRLGQAVAEAGAEITRLTGGTAPDRSS
ncbi:IclR family transcriptional regulator [Ruegeria marina]|uniref:Transcriptional regulator, IclR family n=1 Tax=Ruegeria marina TaxID=639004 RepID=A0A1G7CYD6_9RHOB|nr:IclR family transcriptional regulator [Ruegeria marina]SDE44318.1 transcriptional regulator, IclR family [Ruegeria marina]